jgi:hypothetical protein
MEIVNYFFKGKPDSGIIRIVEKADVVQVVFKVK